jgi:hypothetical protein
LVAPSRQTPADQSVKINVGGETQDLGTDDGQGHADDREYPRRRDQHVGSPRSRATSRRMGSL